MVEAHKGHGAVKVPLPDLDGNGAKPKRPAGGNGKPNGGRTRGRARDAT